MQTKSMALYPLFGRVIGLVSFIFMVGAAGWLWWSGHTDIRYSADHQGTIPILTVWIPALICIMFIRLIPLQLRLDQPYKQATKRPLMVEAIIFFTGAILFTVSLFMIDQQSTTFQSWYFILKMAFLFILPWMGIWSFRFLSTYDLSPQPSQTNRWQWIGPLLIWSIWFYLTYFSIFSKPYVASEIADPMMLLIVLLLGFLINSLLEELFYRVWLQTRLERLLGSWPAIFLTSILWAIWHMAIQSTGEWSVDFATVICNQGVTGLFLGYLWSRYRNLWVLIVIHGLINAPPPLLISIGNALVG